MGMLRLLGIGCAAYASPPLEWVSGFGSFCPRRPVSYTHLDVYKRQALGVAHGALRGRLGTFIDITANLADPLFHIRILHLIFVGIFRLLAFVSLV